MYLTGEDKASMLGAIQQNGGHAVETKDGWFGRLMGSAWFRVNPTQSYVCIPPALLITDRRGDTWTIGREYTQHGSGYFRRFEWNVLMNDVDVGETAERIEYRDVRGGQVSIYGWYGRKTWNGRAFV